jgi:hypothetical protein
MPEDYLFERIEKLEPDFKRIGAVGNWLQEKLLLITTWIITVKQTYTAFYLIAILSRRIRLESSLDIKEGKL